MKSFPLNSGFDASRDLDAAIATLDENLVTRLRADPAVLRATHRIWADSTPNLQKFRCRVQRFLAGEQIEYVLGYQILDGCKFYADRRAYIAQEDSLVFLARLVEECRAMASRVDRPLRVCEIGVGGGALLAALLIRCRMATPPVPIAQVWGLDIDRAALDVAAQNCNGLGVPVTLVESDVLGALPDDAAPDLIFAYPPWGQRDAGDDAFVGSAWEVFHRALPQISCYTVGGQTQVHNAILAQAHERFPKAALFIFNDVLPGPEIDRLTADHPWIAAEPCGPGMTAFVWRG